MHAAWPGNRSAAQTRPPHQLDDALLADIRVVGRRHDDGSIRPLRPGTTAVQVGAAFSAAHQGTCNPKHTRAGKRTDLATATRADCIRACAQACRLPANDTSPTSCWACPLRQHTAGQGPTVGSASRQCTSPVPHPGAQTRRPRAATRAATRPPHSGPPGAPDVLHASTGRHLP